MADPSVESSPARDDSPAAHDAVPLATPAKSLTSALASRSGTSTPVIELSKAELNEQRRNYFLGAHESLNRQKTEDSVKRYKYLLGLTDLFRHFIDARVKKDPKFAEVLEQIELADKKDHSKKRRKTEKEEDAELLKEEDPSDAGEQQTTVFTESPGYVHGQLREYQIQGLNWMVSLYENNINGILADEMGLGKTLQTVSFLGYLRYIRGIAGPHIVIVPKSTLDNWKREFARWTPEVKVLVLQGDKDSRADIVNNELLECNFDVLITSYEMILREKAHLKKFAWQYIVIDEAHRIKNEDSMLSQIIRIFNSRNRLLVTGTPLQNNLHELWALLNFLMPDVFSDSEVFDQWFESQDSDQDKVVKQLHRVLRPFLLRRVKADVETSLLPKKEINLYLGMSDMQVQWYKRILEKDIDAVNGMVGKRDKTRLLNIVMQLRKCCNHPYLFEGAEPGPPFTTDEHLVFNSAKMLVLDKLLKKAQSQGSRVLIFSQMSRMLDILDDYCQFRGYQYCRIDGQTSHEDRIAAIDAYNAPDSEKFVFLLTTRAGGLGINLTTADWVVIYDSDWNPQADLQAMDRAHRIGQTKQVYVFRFVTEHAIEEKVLERAATKLRLDQLVIQQGRSQSTNPAGAGNSGDLLNMIQHGAAEVFQKNAGSYVDDDIDAILSKGEEKTAEMNQKYEKLGLDDLQKFTSENSAYEWNGQDFKKKKKTIINPANWINPPKRERKENYSIDSYYKGVMHGEKEKPHAPPPAPKAPKQLNIQDHQFYPPRLIDIQERETSYYRKLIGYKVPLAPGDDSDLEAREAEQQLEQAEIDDAEPITEEEEKEKIKLSAEGFSSWNRRDFTHFVQLCGKYGRHNYAGIASEFTDKTEADVKAYSKVFWQRYKEIDGYDRYINQIEAGEERSKKTQLHREYIKKKVESYTCPLQQIQFLHPVGHGKRMYSEDEDRFILVQMYRFGLDADNLYEKIRESVRESPMFRFDWFLLSRTAMELSRRGASLITSISKEFEPAGSKRRKDEYDSDDETPEPKKGGRRKKA